MTTPTQPPAPPETPTPATDLAEFRRLLGWLVAEAHAVGRGEARCGQADPENERAEAGAHDFLLSWARRAVERAENAEAELEEYRMRLAGALTTAEGCFLDVQEREDTIPYLRTCPTIRACVAVSRRASVAEALADRLAGELRECRSMLDALPRSHGSHRFDLIKDCVACQVAETMRTTGEALLAYDEAKKGGTTP